jgi:hypothetical protein
VPCYPNLVDTLLIAMAVGRPTATISREPPVAGCLWMYPPSICVLGLEGARRRDSYSDNAHALDRTLLLWFASDSIPTTCFPNKDQVDSLQ